MFNRADRSFSACSTLSAPDHLRLTDDVHGDYISSSPSPSPLASRYEARLRGPTSKNSNKRGLLSLDTSMISGIDNQSNINSACSLSLSCRSARSLRSDRIPLSSRSDNLSLFRFDSVRSTKSYSDSSDSSDSFNSFNLGDRHDHSPLSLMRKKRRVSLDGQSVGTKSDDLMSCSTQSEMRMNRKYDECLQNVLLPQSASSGMHIIPSVDEENRNHHFEECPLSDPSNDDHGTDDDAKHSPSECICKYIMTERLNKIDSPKKVLRFNFGGVHDSENNKQSISCLPDSVKNIMRCDDACYSNGTSSKSRCSGHSSKRGGGVAIPSEPIRTLNLDAIHSQKKLANDYYYHLMDFKVNQKLGCIAMKDALHLIRGHFGDVEDAENTQVIRGMNKQQKVRRSEYHFCSIKLSPNQNAKNAHVLCLGDNVGRLLFYDYCRQKFVHSIYKRNKCRISVLDWRNHFNSRSGIIAAGSLDKAIRVYDDRTYGQCYKLKYHKGEVCGLRWNTNNEHLLLSGGNQNTVCCWDVRKKEKPLFVGKHKAAIRALSWYPHSDTMFISGGGSNDQAIKIWEIGSPSAKLSLLTGSQVCNVECLEYHNEEYLVSSHGFSSNSILIWNMKRECNPNTNSSDVSLTRIKQLCGHKCRVLYLCKYSDSNVVSASAGPDQTLKYWKIFPSQMETPFMHHIQNIIR